MAIADSPCPGEDTLVAFVERRLDDAGWQGFVEHMDVCRDCLSAVAALKAAEAEVPNDNLPHPGDVESADTMGADLRHGVETIGRFRVKGTLGRGGMGTVLLAHDPRLDRDVALKLVDSHRAPTRDVAVMLRRRMVREAKAMARLQHESVATVFEVGVAGDTVYIAMEHLSGGTLTAWLRAARSWREVVTTLIRAGEGLKAAHDAGIVHRDFKPDNILFDAQGNVRVTDFGLARAFDAGPEEVPAVSAVGAASTHLTQTGAMVGTPAYMAPEQHLGLVPDEKSDLFSFCVTLYEALYGRRPYAGKSIPELASAITQGRFAEPPRCAPRKLWALIQRGLNPDPASRFRSMDPLLAELRAIARPRAGRRVALALGLAAAIAAGTLAWVVARSEPAPAVACDQGEQRLVGVWDGPRRQALETAFMDTGKAHAAQTFDRFAAALDRYSEAWGASHRGVCEATHVRGEQSSALLDRRMECLDRRLREFELLIGAVEAHPADSLDGAIAATYELTDVTDCANIAAPTTIVPLPEDAEKRAAVAGLRARLDESEALLRAGRYADAMAIARPAAEHARQLGYAPTTAEALHLLGRLHTKLGQFKDGEAAVLEAVEPAAEAGDRPLVAKMWVHLIYNVGYHQQRLDEGMMYVTHAKLALAEFPDELLRARRLHNTALVVRDRGNHDGALAALREGLAIRTQLLGEDHPRVASSLNSIGVLMSRMGRLREAEAALTRALAIRERIFGIDHPNVASPLNNLANVHMNAGRYERARALVTRAIAIRNSALGPQHPRTARALGTLGQVELAAGQYERARVHFTEKLRINRKVLGQDHPSTASAMHRLGRTLAELGRAKEGLRAIERGLTLEASARGAEYRNGAFALESRATALFLQGQHGAAREDLRRALEILSAVRRDDHGERLQISILLGLVEHGDGNPEVAATLCRDALSRLDATQRADHPFAADALVCLVRAALATGDDASAHLARAAKIRENPSLGDLARIEVDVLRLRAGALPGQGAPEVRRALSEHRAATPSVRGDALAAELEAWLRSK